LSRAAAFSPTDSEIYVLRGTAYLYVTNVDAALTDFAKALELNPRSAGAFLGRGMAHAREEDFDDALSDLGRALAYDPQSDLTHAHRAVVYAQMGTPELGLKDVERGLKINAKSAHAFWARGEIELALGRREPAIASLRQALDHDPEHRDAKLALARLGVEYEPPGVELEGAGFDAWQVLQFGRRFVAVNAEYPRVRVPLEMLGGEKPHILDFELKERPFNGIGILRFYGGKTRVGVQQVDVEQAAIIDLSRGNVVAIEPYRLGQVLSRWQWGNGRVVVTSADGLTSEFRLRRARQQPVATRRDGYGQQKWVPPWALEREDGYGARPPPRRRARSRRRKPKSLFDMIFN
jgi:tetratricopeptide (TPR) repeat protein